MASNAPTLYEARFVHYTDEKSADQIQNLDKQLKSQLCQSPTYDGILHELKIPGVWFQLNPKNDPPTQTVYPLRSDSESKEPFSYGVGGFSAEKLIVQNFGWKLDMIASEDSDTISIYKITETNQPKTKYRQLNYALVLEKRDQEDAQRLYNASTNEEVAQRHPNFKKLTNLRIKSIYACDGGNFLFSALESPTSDPNEGCKVSLKVPSVRETNTMVNLFVVGEGGIEVDGSFLDKVQHVVV